jgi:ketosteroid isomerase-like protein
MGISGGGIFLPVLPRDIAWAMSQENVEIARQLFDEFQAGLERDDPGSWFDSEVVAEDYEWIVPTPLDGRSVWRGPRGLRRVHADVDRAVRQLGDEVECWIDAGEDRVVALTCQTATGKS